MLAAIADVAGGDWPQRARLAFVKIMGDEDDADRGVLLLAHIRDAFDTDAERRKAEPAGDDRLATANLLRSLVERGDDSPWAGWSGKDIDDGNTRKPAMRLAPLSRPYRIGPKPVRVGEAVVKGYERADFEDAWSRFVPA